MHLLIEKLLISSNLSTVKSPDLDSWQAFLSQLDEFFHSMDSEKEDQQQQIKRSLKEMQLAYDSLKDVYENRQTAILKAFPDLLFLINEQGIYLQILAENQQDLTLPEQQMIGKSLAETMPTDKADFFMQCIKKVLQTNELQILEYELQVQRGMESFEGRVIPSGYTVDGQKTVLYLARNITERQKVESQHKLLNSVMASATEGIVIVRADKKVLYVNSAIEKLTGYSKQELLNEGEGFLRHQLDKELCDDLCRQAWSGDHFRRQIVIHGKNGNKTDILLSMDTLRSDSGDIEYFVGMLTDISEIKSTQERLQHLATHDVLTGLPNRMMFEERVSQVISRSIRNGQKGAVMFLDLDRFKTINDSLGHRVGDKLLIEVASRLSSVCRVEDTVARFGGDEFVILVEEIERTDQVFQMAKKILHQFDQQFQVMGYEFKMTTSIGISIFPAQGKYAEELIKQADAAMYEAKKLGRNRYQMFANEYLESAMAGLTLENEMQNALIDNQFVLYFQPQFDLNENRLSGFEALIRWQHPQHGMIPPAKFIQVAESTGQIMDIGLWVFTQVCTKIVEWSAKDIQFGIISFNLSQRQLMDVNLAVKLISILHSTGANKYAHQIECEITESLIIKQMDVAFNNLIQLKEAGLKMAIDDFGTGHSSLVNLKRFPLNRLKIDIEFVRDIGKDQNDEEIIKATIALAEGFGLEVVAEGVEEVEQLEFLQSVGCHQIQGYLISKPVASDQVEHLLNKEFSF